MEGEIAEAGNSPADEEHIQIQESSLRAHVLVIPLSII